MPRSSDDLFRALADPTRRRILDLLAERGTATVGELADQFPDLVASGISEAPHGAAGRRPGLQPRAGDGSSSTASMRTRSPTRWHRG